MSEQDIKSEADTIPAIAITFQHELDGNRRLVLQSYIGSDCSDEAFNEALDKLSRVSDRQNAKTTLPTTRNLLELKKQRLHSETEREFEAREVLAQQDQRWRDEATSSGRRNFKFTPQQVQDRTRMQADIARSESNVKVLKQEIEELELQVSMWESKMGGKA